MRALVTGGNGFVGRHLCAELRARGCETLVAGRSSDAPGAVDVELDLADDANVRRVVAAARADVVFHLAAQAFVPRSNEDPLGTFDTNVMGTARLVEALRAAHPGAPARLVFVSSGEVYGAHPASDLPLREDAFTAPSNPYAASKLAGEAIVLAATRAKAVAAVVTRAFNQIGPGQSAPFVVPSFAARLARIAAGGDPVLTVGNLEPKRDFLDVRDVVRAYADLGARGVAGEVYNVCSGSPVAIVDILRKLVTIAHVGVEIREDPALVRAVDVPIVYGDNAKLRAATGWTPAYGLAQSLRDVFDEAARNVEARA
ncbi:MAG: GDP-mannose 4,6-dehydratase [Candidatus Eremiobacteraeota bacterium]|nr:GDP-mannose 4,6-dehydratase [Candidatus Eremiobacteraeota bacterium]